MVFDSGIALLRGAVRGALARPGSSSLVVAALALGIGATTAMFSVVDAVLFRSLQAERPHELVRVVATDETRTEQFNHSFPVYTDYRDQSDAFASLAAYSAWQAVHLSTGGRVPERVTASLATSNLFDVLGLRPQHGRLLRPDDDRPGARPVVVLSDRSFRRRFGADPGVVGSSVRVNGNAMTVVGVAPRGFTGVALDSLPELYVPIVHLPLVEPEHASEKPLETRRMIWLDIVGRLRPGVSLAQAQASLDLIATRRAAAQPEDEKDPMALVLKAAEAMLGPEQGRTTRRLYWLLLGVSTLVLLIACADAASLLLARGERRRRELAIRVAVGASRGHVVRQLLAESLLLAGAAALGGTLLAAWGAEALVAAVPPEVALPVDAATPVLEPRVVAVAVLAGLAAGLVAGLTPALRGSRSPVLEGLRDEAWATTSGRRATLRNGLVVAQVALSCVLLVGAGLLLRTLQNLNRLGPGFEPRGLVLASFELARQGYDAAEGALKHEELLRAVRATPGIESASLARSAPVQASGMRVSFQPDGYVAAAGERIDADFNVVTPGHFATLGVTLVRGRDFEAGDVAGAQRVAVVSRALAEKYWPGRDAVGQTIRDLGPASGTFVVVGVAPDLKLRQLNEEPRQVVYASLPQWYMSRMTLVARSPLGERETIAAVRRAVASVDPELPLFRVRTLEDHIAASLARERLLALLFSGFGALALALSWAGLYGLVSFVTALRTREIGVRVALGAGTDDVVRLVVGQSLRLAGTGLAIGLASALALARVLSSQLYGVSPSDGPTLAAVALLLLAASAVAGHLPARRALRVEPSTALRHE
jgi:predicted permease